MPTLRALNGQLMAPRPDLGVDPHVASAFRPSLRQKADVDNVCVAADGRCCGQDVSHAVEDVEPLHQHLLCIAEHEAGGEAGLELGCSEGDQVADMESKKEWQSVGGFGEESMGYLPLNLSSQLGKAGGVHDEGAT